MSQATPEQRTENRTRQERREHYHKLIRIVELNTGGKQRATAALSTPVTIASYCDISPRQAKSSLSAAVEQNDLLEHDGRYATTDTESLRAVLAEEAERDEMRKELVAKCNRLLAAGGDR